MCAIIWIYKDLTDEKSRDLWRFTDTDMEYQYILGDSGPEIRDPS